MTSTVQGEKERNTRRVASAIPGEVCAVRGERVLPEGLHLQQENRVCGLRRKPAVLGEKVCSTRRVASLVLGEGCAV